MGSKKLKGIAVRGTGQPNVADHKLFLAALDEARAKLNDSSVYDHWRNGGTTGALEANSARGLQAVKNYREGTFTDAKKLGVETSKKYMKDWVSYSDLSSFVVGYAWQLICQVSPWL